jgi:hypothetical protein
MYFNTDTTEGCCNAPGWWDPSGVWSIEYINLDRYNNRVFYAIESYNQTEDPTKAHCYLETGTYNDIGDLEGDGWWESSHVWWDPDGTFRYPEIEHVQDETFILTCFHQNATNTSILFGVSFNNGSNLTNDALYYWSGDDQCIMEYRNLELSSGHGGRLVAWQYIYDDPEDDLKYIHYDYNWVAIQGYVTDQDSGAPYTPIEVEMENTDAEHGFTVDAFIDENFFWRNMILGFEIWTSPEPAEFRINATDPTAPEYTNETIVAYDEIYIAGNWVNLTIKTEEEIQFIRGMVDEDLVVTMADALHILKWLYVPGTPDPNCNATMDADDDGLVTMADALYILKWLYVPGSPNPPLPFCVGAGCTPTVPGDCGPDPTPDDLECLCHTQCMDCT